MPATIRSHARTDVGRVREHNEDNFLVDRRLGLYVVCDGMGGHASGEVASALAVQGLRDALKKDEDFLLDFAKGDASVRPEDVKNLLESAAHAANAAVFSEAQRDASKRGMGTTLTALVLVGGYGFIAHVGDSRCYLYRGGEVRMLTEDHSVINELKRRGKLTPQILEKIGNKNAVTRAVGVYETVEVDTFHFLTAPGDRYLLCSDGLHGYVEKEEELNALVAGLGEEIATQRLIDIANERGGKDNITAVIATIAQDDGDASDMVLAYETLAGMPFFRHLEPRELLRVQAMARPRAFKDTDTVVTEGTPGDSIFVVLKGNAKVQKGDAEIARFEAGHFFGEMSLIEKAPRSATVLSDGASQMLEIARADFFKILREEKDIGVKLLWNFVTELSKRLRATSQNLAAVKEQMNSTVEDLSDADVLLFEDEAPPAQAPVPRAPRVPSLRAVTPEATSDTMVPPGPQARPSAPPGDDGETHTSAVIQRRRVVTITSDPNEPLPSAPVAAPAAAPLPTPAAQPAPIEAAPAEDTADADRKTDPPPAGEPPDEIDDRPTVVPPEPDDHQ
ncbi:MAG: Stp1/IreP family PP2C-type Ser/Thr phosphatase [Myxococcales bacterium]|nr:Stp1/IreP family PP2C-type Ser/Thr phosphatase [Myxococcales bacterium]